MADPRPAHDPALAVQDGEQGIGLVRVATDLTMRMVRHVAPPLRNGSQTTTIVAGGAALSYNQLDGADPASRVFGFGAILGFGWPGGSSRGRSAAPLAGLMRPGARRAAA